MPSVRVTNWFTSISVLFAGWSISVLRKLFSIAPIQSAVFIITDILSQLTLVAAFLLPIKVVILLGSDGIPRYFPDWFLQYSREDLALGLGGIAILSYMVHLLANGVCRQVAQVAELRISDHTQKLSLFPGQGELTQSVFKQFLGIVSMALFATVALLVLAAFYPGLVGVLISGLLVCYLGVSIGSDQSEFRHWLLTDYATLSNVCGNVLFLVGSAYVVADLLWFSNPNMFIAIVGIVVARQVVSRISGSVNDAVSITKRRSKVDVLLFHGQIYRAANKDAYDPFWNLITPELRDEWLIEELGQLVGPVRDLSASWVETRRKGLVAYHVDAVVGGAKQRFYVKIFNKGLQAEAEQEEIFLRSVDLGSVPAPEFVGSTIRDECRVHFFEGLHTPNYKQSDVFETLRSLHIQLWESVPSETLYKRFIRTRPTLDARLTKEKVARLFVAAETSEDRELIERLGCSIDQIETSISRVRLAFRNPGLAPQNVWQTSEGRFVVANWGQWSIDPIGAGWPVAEERLDRLADLIELAEQGSHMPIGDPTNCQLVALVFELLSCNEREWYQTALMLIPQILDRLEYAKSGSCVQARQLTN